MPDWIAAGARLTWYEAAAAIAQSNFQWVERPCDEATWTDPATGKCYVRTDEPGPFHADPATAAGDGLSQIDVIAVDGANVVLSADLYTFDRTMSNGNLIWTPAGGQSEDGSNVDGAWINPAILGQFTGGGGTSGLTVLRGNYQLGSTTYDAISLVNGLGGGSSYYSYTYDTRTGVLLSANTTTPGRVTTPIVGPTDVAPPRSNSELTMARFQNFRLRTIPGTGAALPDSIATASELDYQGTYHFVNPFDPSSGSLDYPIAVSVTFGSGGAAWRSFSARTLIPDLPEDSRALGVTGPTGVYAYSPAALATMTAGQVLDQDPVTGEVVTVAAVAPSANGSTVVEIDSQLPGNLVRSTYDLASGLLVAYETQSASNGQTISLQLVNRR